MNRRIRPSFVGLCVIGVLSCFVTKAFAQISFSAPSTSTTISDCDDFAVEQFNDPWDLSNTEDVNNFVTDQDISSILSPSISGGLFSGTVNSTGAYAQLWTLLPDSTYITGPNGTYGSGGRWGTSQDMDHKVNLDTSKYDTFTIRMNSNKFDSNGFRLFLQRGPLLQTYTALEQFPVLKGWNSYILNMNSVSFDSGFVTDSWASGSIYGLSIMPALTTGTEFQVDWMTLEDSTSCGSTTASYTANASGNNDLYNIWIDDDTNPFNGYFKKIKTAATAAGSDTTSVSALSLFPSSYKVIGLLDSDYATLERDDPWDFNEETDVTATGSISGESLSGGTLSGTVSGNTSQIYMRLSDGGIDASKYSKLSLKVTLSNRVSGFIRVFVNDSGGFFDLYPGTHDVDNDNVFQKDLSSEGAWTGTIDTFIVQIIGSGINFSLDFVSLRKSGFETSRDSTDVAGSVVAASGSVKVNAAPLIDIREPNNKGGVALQPWNMNNTNDLVVFDNLTDDPDPSYSNSTGELYSTFLPDVRLEDGRRGDFFKGTTDASFGTTSGDPINYSIFPDSNTTDLTFSSDDYRNLCFMMKTTKDYNLEDGSVTVIIWGAENDMLRNSAGLPTIYDNWTTNKWFEYCVDMKKIHREGTTENQYNGMIESFRVDPHEFPVTDTISRTTHYFDWIKLRKDDTSHGKFTIVLDTEDSDGDSVSVDLYYNTAASTTGGTKINTSALDESTNAYIWDTSSVPNGSYYIYAVATDGINTTKRLSTGRIKVDNSSADQVSPVLSLESPSSGQTFCDSIQLKGYALQTDRFEEVALVEVLVDGAEFASIHPGLYSPNAVAAYPDEDSSNTGFNATYDFSAFSIGAHTITVKAYSTDGSVTTTNVSVTKGTTGCADIISDSDPSGSPLEVDLNIPLPEMSGPTLGNFKQTKKGVVNGSVTGIGSENCTIKLEVGPTNVDTSNSFINFTVTSSDESKDKLTLQAKKVNINKKLVSELCFRARKSCEGYQDSSSEVTCMKVKTKKGLKEPATASTAITNKIKRKAKKAKKKNNKK